MHTGITTTPVAGRSYNQAYNDFQKPAADIEPAEGFFLWTLN